MQLVTKLGLLGTCVSFVRLGELKLCTMDRCFSFLIYYYATTNYEVVCKNRVRVIDNQHFVLRIELF